MVTLVTHNIAVVTYCKSSDTKFLLTQMDGTISGGDNIYGFLKEGEEWANCGLSRFPTIPV